MKIKTEQTTQGHVGICPACEFRTVAKARESDARFAASQHYKRRHKNRRKPRAAAKAEAQKLESEIIAGLQLRFCPGCGNSLDTCPNCHMPLSDIRVALEAVTQG